MRPLCPGLGICNLSSPTMKDLGEARQLLFRLRWAEVDETHVCVAHSGCRLLAGFMSWNISHELFLHRILMLFIACHGQQTAPDALAQQAGGLGHGV